MPFFFDEVVHALLFDYWKKKTLGIVGRDGYLAHGSFT